MLKYLFSHSLSRADCLVAILITSLYTSGSLSGWEAFGYTMVGLLLTSIGEQVLEVMEAKR